MARNKIVNSTAGILDIVIDRSKRESVSSNKDTSLFLDIFDFMLSV